MGTPEVLKAFPERMVVWHPARQALDTSEQVLSSVAPVYHRGQLMGVVIVDINLSTLTRSIRNLGREFGGFGFVIETDGHLIAAPDAGQRLLVGCTMQPNDLRTISVDAVTPAFKPVMTAIRERTSEAITVDLGGPPRL